MVTGSVILLPGVVTPADISYGALLPELSGFEVIAKNLSLYDGDTPPDDYSLDSEVESLLAAAEKAGFREFHLAGYSGGGAIALAFAARHPERLMSLALMEPAWFGNRDLTEVELAVRKALEAVESLPPQEMLSAFARQFVADGAKMPPVPPGDPPPWMAKRSAGIKAMGDAFERADLDLSALHNFRKPVLFIMGGLSNTALYEAMANRAKSVFADTTIEVFADRYHFDPPHRAEPERLAATLTEFWTRARRLQ